MPVIPMRPDVLENPNVVDLASVWATMIWPDDVTMVHDAVASAKAAVLAKIISADPEPETMIPPRGHSWQTYAVWAGSVQPISNIHAAGGHRVWHGAIAGLVTLEAVRSHKEGGQKTLGSIKAAAAKSWWRKGVGKGKLSVATIDNTIWPLFKPVAHLWAAHFAVRQQHGGVELPCKPEELSLFLALAMDVLRAGAEVKTNRGPMLDLATAWTIPHEIRLPALRFGPPHG